MLAEEFARDALVLAEDVAAFGVAEALHHLGVADDVGEEDRGQCGRGDGDPASCVCRTWLCGGALVQELHDCTDGLRDVVAEKQMALAGQGDKPRVRNACRHFLGSSEGKERVFDAVQYERRCLDLGKDFRHVCRVVESLQPASGGGGTDVALDLCGDGDSVVWRVFSCLEIGKEAGGQFPVRPNKSEQAHKVVSRHDVGRPHDTAGEDEALDAVGMTDGECDRARHADATAPERELAGVGGIDHTLEVGNHQFVRDGRRIAFR